MKIQTAEFVTSVGPTGPLPAGNLPQVAMVGRSNVGKSTLINGLTRRTVARAGAAPGTTRLLNIYRVELARRRGKLLLIDLPGYGYVRGPDATKVFDRLTRRYFMPHAAAGPNSQEGTGPACAVLLVDGRHPGLANDCDALTWLCDLELPLLVAATKMDRMKPSERTRALRQHEAALGQTVLPTSGKNGDDLDALWKALLDLTGL